MAKIKMIGNISKFSFGEMTSNDNGKTSVTSTSGAYVIFIGGICFILGCIDKMFFSSSIDIVNQSIMFTTIGAALLGVKNIVRGKYPQVEIEEDEAQPAPTTPPAPPAPAPTPSPVDERSAPVMV